jgi:hypothetical protein
MRLHFGPHWLIDLFGPEVPVRNLQSCTITSVISTRGLFHEILCRKLLTHRRCKTMLRLSSFSFSMERRMKHLQSVRAIKLQSQCRVSVYTFFVPERL